MFASYNPSRPTRSTGNRKVFENSMVAHVWAQQSQSEGRSGNGNFYFRDSTIYSYGAHFPIARFSADKSVVWFTRRAYSVTTSMHIRYVENAIRGLHVERIFVPDLGAFDERHISADERAAIEESLMRANREAAWEAFQRVAGTPRRKWPGQIEAINRVAELDAKRAKAALAEKVSDARHTIDMAAIGVSSAFVPKVLNEQIDGHYPTPYYTATDNARRVEMERAKVMSARATLSKQSTKSKADAKRIKTASRCGAELARIRDVWRNIVAAMEASRDYEKDRAQIEGALAVLRLGAKHDYWYSPDCDETEILAGRIRRAFAVDFTSEQIAPLMAVMHARQWRKQVDANVTAEARQIVYERQRASWSKPAVTADQWRNGAGDKYQYGFGDTLLRRKGDTLQTSRGAECPFKHAVIAFLKAQECRATGTEWHRNGQQIRVGVFQVDAIDAQGNMRAGCHSLAWEEMERLAIREVPHLVKPRFGLPVVSSL